MAIIYGLVIVILIPICITKGQKLPPADVAKITYFNNYEGLYYKSLGNMKITNLDWKLISFLDLEQYTTEYLTLLKLYNRTSLLCTEGRQKSANPDTTHICHKFAQATLPYLNEIETNHQNILYSIGQQEESRNRTRRGLTKAFSRTMNTLYGSLENIDFGFIFNQIRQLIKNKENDVNLMTEKIRITKTSMDEVKSTISQVLTNQQKIEQNIQILSEQIKQNTQNISHIKFRTILLEQMLLFEVQLNQYVYDTQNLLAIVNFALNGKLHTSILPTKKWIMELKEIKINIPTGTALPFDVKVESISEFIKISELTIFHKDQYIIFIVKIPLVQNLDFNVYNIIPIPRKFNNKSYIVIEPEFEILAISSDMEKFFSLTNKQWETCRELEKYTLCKNSQPIHHRSKNNVCEIALFSNPQTLPDTCKIKFISVNICVWHRLLLSNSWLFHTQSEIITINCENPTRTFTFKIYGVGRLTVIASCKIHTDKTLLLPSSYIKPNTYADIIPENPNIDVKQSLADLLNLLEPQNITNVQIVKDLTEFTNNLQELSTLNKRPTDPSIFEMINVHVTILYVVTFCFISLSIFVICKFNRKIIRMYKPELAEIELSEHCETSGTIKPPCSILG